MQIYKTLLLSSEELGLDSIHARLLCAKPSESSTLPDVTLGFMAQSQGSLVRHGKPL